MDKNIEYSREKDYKGEGARGFLSKLSKGLMLPIAVLPIAGLFLGIGSGIINIFDTVGLDKETNPWYLIPIIMRDIGNIIFATLPALFCVAIAIAYTDDAGIAAFTGFLGYVVFCVSQAVLIFENVDANGVLINYHILWYDEVPTSVVGQTLGITSLQTSVFGGIAVGFVAAWLYNRFSTLRLPNFLGFFNGTRSVPIIAFMFMPLVAFIFLATWPLIGTWLDSFGQLLLGMNYGFDALLFGIIERALVPFGLHHAFYTPLWFTSVGGQIIAVDPSTGQQLVVSAGDENMWFAIQNYGLDYNSLNTQYWVEANDTILNLTGMSNNYWVFDPNAAGGASTNINDYLLPSQNLDFNSGTNECVYFITSGAHPGQYLQGKYQFMIFALPAAGAAMIMCAKKENREMAMSLIGAAVLTTFLTGITEPIEFTFLFLAPMLYVFHVLMCGISFWVDDLLQVSAGMTFSGGIIDYCLYGILPLATGYNTAAWIIIPIGIIYMPIYYFFFRWYILKFDIQTPGRGDSDDDMKLVSKKDYLESKDAKKENKNLPKGKKGYFDESNPRFERTVSLLGYLGDFDNLKSINSCITRLRLSVVDVSKIDEESLKKKLGAKGIMKLSGGSVQVIFGAEADIFKVELQMLKKQGFTYKEWSEKSKNN